MTELTVHLGTSGEEGKGGFSFALRRVGAVTASSYAGLGRLRLLATLGWGRLVSSFAGLGPFGF